MFDVLFQELLTLEHHMRKHSLNLILGGGMGLWLRDTFYDATYTHPRSPRYPLRPTSRSTQDLDLLLTASIIVDAEAMNQLRDILATLNYQPSVQYLQFTIGLQWKNSRSDSHCPCKPMMAKICMWQFLTKLRHYFNR